MSPTIPGYIVQKQVRVKQVLSFHGVLGETDDEASESATVDLIAMFTAFLEPKIVTEAGTYHAHVTGAVANILRQLKQGGMIYTADVIDYGLNNALLANPSGQLLAPHVRFHHGDYLEMLKDLPGPIDLAYIDASSLADPHLRMGHADATYELLSPGAVMFVDDTAATDWEDASKFRETAAMYLAPHRGLSIFQKRDA